MKFTEVSLKLAQLLKNLAQILKLDHPCVTQGDHQNVYSRIAGSNPK